MTREEECAPGRNRGGARVEVIARQPAVRLAFPMPSCGHACGIYGVSLTEFMKLTKVPIFIYFGDNIPKQATAS
jgi:hypothetical protein